jgi:hypothetical protein
MSDYRGTIKHAAHVSCKSRIHTSRVDALASVEDGVRLRDTLGDGERTTE